MESTEIDIHGTFAFVHRIPGKYFDKKDTVKLPQPY